MSLLLDTHALLWWLADDPKLAAGARAAIARSDDQVFVSAATAWEIAIKVASGKLDAPDNLAEELREHRFQELPVRVDHALLAGALPEHHRDPFDRMLIAQAILEDLTLVTRDRIFEKYDVTLLPT